MAKRKTRSTKIKGPGKRSLRALLDALQKQWDNKVKDAGLSHIKCSECQLIALGHWVTVGYEPHSKKCTLAKCKHPSVQLLYNSLHCQKCWTHFR